MITNPNESLRAYDTAISEARRIVMSTPTLVANLDEWQLEDAIQTLAEDAIAARYGCGVSDNTLLLAVGMDDEKVH